MVSDGTQLDVTTLLIGLAVIVFAVSLAQLCILIISGYLKRKARQEKTGSSGKKELDNETS